jgi:hypothetical protein
MTAAVYQGVMLNTMDTDKSAKEIGDKAMSWLPDMDLNHDKQIQSLLCYRYTIGQAVAA